MTATIENLATATPVEIDGRLADLHDEIAKLNSRIEYLTNHVLSYSGLRRYVSATRWAKSHYEVTGTFEEGIDRLRTYAAAVEAWRAADYAQELRPQPLSNYAGSVDIDKTVAERTELLAARYALWTEANRLEDEYRARRWTRYFLVTSSAGHIHSTTGCQTCRVTTEYGWMPQMSGQTEAEAIAGLGIYAESLCSVCFPTAPVAAKRTNVPKAKAAKMAAAPVCTAAA